jgi:phosphoglycerate dehydrogenase-like enzyme
VARRARATVLVYAADGAAECAALIRAPRGRVDVRVARTPEEAAPHASDADVLYAWKFPPALWPRATRVRWLQVMGAGVDWALDTVPPHVVVTRMPGVFGPWMREYVVAWCAWVTQRIETYRAAQARREWRQDLPPDRLQGKTLALVGLGDIGRAIARGARAVGMRVVGVSRSGRAVPGIARVYRVADLPRALAAADFVALVLPLTKETRGLVGAEALAAMRPTAWLINVGRGAVVDEAALVEALAARRIAGAILDVFETEPLPPAHPFWALDNAVVTPHISGPNVPAELAPVFDDNLARWLAGRRLRHVVDPARGY